MHKDLQNIINRIEADLYVRINSRLLKNKIYIDIENTDGTEHAEYNKVLLKHTEGIE